MKKILMVWGLIISIATFAQGDTTFYQQIHFQLDKEAYVAGDTIWFKAYLMADFFPDIIVEGAITISIGFYNSDTAKRFHITLEGFTKNGKLVYFDKIME